MSKLVILDGHGLNPGDLNWKGFEDLVPTVVYDRTPPEEIVPRIGDADLVVVNKTPVSAATLAACPAVRYVGVLATGFNIVDVRAAKERGVVVTNIPAYATDSVAEFTFALLLEICHRVGDHSRAVHAGRWTASRDFCFWDYPLLDLAGKTLGIVGYGRIGQAVARLAEAFGMKVLHHNAHSDPPGSVSLDELYARSDVITLHCPLSDENRGMIGRAAIAKMKDGVILVNTARGPLVDAAALREALLSGKVYAAAVDVADTEPLPADFPLLGLDNCVITPHIAWASLEARTRLMDTAVANLRAFLGGKPANNVAG